MLGSGSQPLQFIRGITGMKEEMGLDRVLIEAPALM
jgi:hypothetical protein